MIVELTPKYKFICDRCGKEEYVKNNIPEQEVIFLALSGAYDAVRMKGQVCYKCFKEFCEIAGNFFDEVNKEFE